MFTQKSMPIQGSFIHNCQNCPSVGKQINKTLVYPYNGILLNSDMGESEMHYAKCKKPNSKNHGRGKNY